MNLLINDKSRRSRSIFYPFIATMAAILAILIGSFWWVGAQAQYSAMVNASSTPIGTELTFSQSGATVTMSGIYTDRNKDSLVVRLTPDDKAQQTLPYRGDEFAVFGYSDSVRKYKEIPILFGKMGSDGDYFLVLPNPTDDVYSFMLVNTNPSVGSASDNQKDLESTQKRLNSKKGQDSIAKDLSDFNSNAVLDKESDDKAKKKSKKSGDNAGTVYDRIGFRVTLDPAREEEKYQPTAINENLMDGEDFRFNILFDRVLKDTAIQELTREYNDQNVVTTQWENDKSRLEERMAYNPDDKDTQKQLELTESGLKDAKKRQDEIVDEITRYESLEYDDSMFQNMQTSATVVKP